MANVMRVIWVIVKVVVDPYMVSSSPGEIKVRHVGDTVTLNCSAGGSPLPKVMWFKGGRRINFRVSNHKAKNIRNSFVHPHQVTSKCPFLYHVIMCCGKPVALQCIRTFCVSFTVMAGGSFEMKRGNSEK
ncbi:hypothetical protein pdam_00024433 [Pocillopora damicornis]|uniref:Ig-like domain-containing protein n=1 Tax=Pocillopora damicornis TaxID=46731 RepID=A0A3M6TM81_POCDA|nr:hypothetical protein pdam_00024433 [Pocillopora damicornis]